MTKYLISFDDGAMTFPEEELPDVSDAAHAVVQEAKNAGVFVFAGGLKLIRSPAATVSGSVPERRIPASPSVSGIAPASLAGVHIYALLCERNFGRRPWGGCPFFVDDRRHQVPFREQLPVSVCVR